MIVVPFDLRHADYSNGSICRQRRDEIFMEMRRERRIPGVRRGERVLYHSNGRILVEDKRTALSALRGSIQRKIPRGPLNLVLSNVSKFRIQRSFVIFRLLPVLSPASRKGILAGKTGTAHSVLYHADFLVSRGHPVYPLRMKRAGSPVALRPAWPKPCEFRAILSFLPSNGKRPAIFGQGQGSRRKTRRSVVLAETGVAIRRTRRTVEDARRA